VASGSSSWFGLATMLAAVSLVIAVGGYLLVREYARDMRSAEQQVSFVNQVSHELKTPLTNIRMYAELLERDFDQMETKVEDGLRGRLAVILSESQRLSRLIGNVLTFARHQRDTLSLRPVDTVPGQVVEQIVDRFRPALEEKGIAIEIDNDGEKELSIDTDILEQIVGNLISNVEKYAAEGGRISIESRVAGNRLSVDIRDVGPGIEPSKRGLVFEPFRRACNDVSSAAGTGIGLSIARELARLHGGDLVLKESDQGCWFQATLQSKEP
jgi:signal transduction histidine kinase